MTILLKSGMTLKKPTGGKLVMAPTYVGIDDPDAAVYVAAVEAADGQSLETATKVAIHSFVKGCKNDGIWPAIKASCILAGARTLQGALVPLVGIAPTNNNFVSGDYNRKTGLVGNGTNKSLDSNRANNADPQNSKHGAVYVTTAATSAAGRYPNYLGVGGANPGAFVIGRLENDGLLYFRNNNQTLESISPGSATGFIGTSRSNSSNYIARVSQVNSTKNQASSTPVASNIGVFFETGGFFGGYVNGRMAFYSIGESLNLALLDARVTDLINSFGAAIP